MYFKAQSKTTELATTPTTISTTTPKAFTKSSTKFHLSMTVSNRIQKHRKPHKYDRLTKSGSHDSEPKNEPLAPIEVLSMPNLETFKPESKPFSTQKLVQKLPFRPHKSQTFKIVPPSDSSKCVCSCIPKFYKPKLNEVPVQKSSENLNEFNLCFYSIDSTYGDQNPSINIQTPEGPSALPPFIFKFDSPKPRISLNFFPPQQEINSILVPPSGEGCNHEENGELVCNNPNL